MKRNFWKGLEKEYGIGEKINLVNLIEKINSDNLSDLAFYFDDGKKKEKFSYSDLFLAVNKFANLLKKDGVRKGDRVALFLPKIWEMYVGILAVVKLGAVAMPLFEAFQSEGLELRLKRGDVKVLITNKELSKRCKKIDKPKSLKKIEIVDSFIFRRRFRKMDSKVESVLVGKKETALMIFTSSTAGTPVAGIEIPHQAAVQWIYTGKKVLGFDKGINYWCTAHPAWVTGIVYGIFSPLLNQSSIYVLEGRFDSHLWTSFLISNKIHVWYTAPTALRLLRKDVRKSDLENLKVLASVGEALPESIFKYFKKLGISIRDTYWQTETGAMIIANLSGKSGVLGKVLDGLNVKLIDGEICIEKPWPAMMAGIYKHNKMYKSYFSGKWFKTNDFAKTDKKGNFYFEGRHDSIIKTSGERVSPLEIENILLEHRSVKEVAVIGVPDKIRGSVLKAFVVLENHIVGSDNLKKELSEFVKKNYAGHAYPKIVEFIDKLPKGNSGKILRGELEKIR